MSEPTLADTSNCCPLCIGCATVVSEAIAAAQADATRVAYREAAEMVKALGPVDYTADSQAAGFNAALTDAANFLRARARSLEGE